jgi:glutamyl-tRNA synthetase
MQNNEKENSKDFNEDLENEIIIQCLKNALIYGKADHTKIIGKILAKFPDKKNNIKQIIELAKIQEQKINKLDKDELEKLAIKYNVKIEQTNDSKKEDEEKKIFLEGAKIGEVVTRFPPEPSGYLHIGHAKALFLNYYAAKQYNGKMILRFDDTNPQKASWHYVEEIKKELQWLGVVPDYISYSSDNMELFYEYARKIIKKGFAYVCKCTQEQIKEGRIKKKRCACSNKTIEQNLEEFEKLKNGEYEEGEAVLRLKGEMESENTTLRDPTLFRVVKKEHYKQGTKYCLWPVYDFAVGIMDSKEGVTHAMRSKEYELRDELYYYILDKLELKKPKIISFSRLAIKGMPVSKRLINPLIAQKLVQGYDDPRLPTLAGLRRRGIEPQAIKEFVLSFGLSKVESEPTIEKLLVLNKKIIDSKSQRRFFVSFPMAQIILDIKEQEIELKNHPIEDLGKRHIKLKENPIIYVPYSDVKDLKIKDRFRLKDFCLVEINNIQKTNNEHILSILECKKIDVLEQKENKTEKKIQWVSDENKIKTKIFIVEDLFVNEEYNKDSLKIIEGYAEKECLNDQEKKTYQFERFGFVVLDKKEKDQLLYIFSCK